MSALCVMVLPGYAQRLGATAAERIKREEERGYSSERMGLRELGAKAVNLYWAAGCDAEDPRMTSLMVDPCHPCRSRLLWLLWLTWS